MGAYTHYPTALATARNQRVTTPSSIILFRGEERALAPSAIDRIVPALTAPLLR